MFFKRTFLFGNVRHEHLPKPFKSWLNRRGLHSVWHDFKNGLLASLLAWNVCKPSWAQECQIQEEIVHSSQLNADRTIHIYLPASYEKETQRRYPVLYLHDGQNIFSTGGTNCAFGWGSWQLDKTADELARAQKMQEVIMVAVDNSAIAWRNMTGG